MADAPVESRLNPRGSLFVAIFGRKGTGKSTLAHRLFATYPYDRIVIDPHADTRPGGPLPVDDAEEITAPVPVRLMTAGEGRGTWRFVGDPASPTHHDDLDRVVGLAYNRRGSLLWIDEVSELSPNANRTPPHFARALTLGRHRDLSMLQATIRPQRIDPRVINQADYVYVFAVANPADRRRIADNIGWDPKEFDAAVRGLAEHGYLRYEARAHELVEFPALPLRPARA